jgi:hypothetical protein
MFESIGRAEPPEIIDFLISYNRNKDPDSAKNECEFHDFSITIHRVFILAIQRKKYIFVTIS